MLETNTICYICEQNIYLMGKNHNPNPLDSTTTSIDLKEFSAPLRLMSSELDRSVGWLVRKMVKEHPSMAHLKEKEKQKAAKA